MFLHQLECDLDDYEVYTCIDTGALISILYMSETLLKLLYPNYEKKVRGVTVQSADGSSVFTDLYRIEGIDILLSADAFFNSTISIFHRKDKDTEEWHRVFSVETIRNRCWLKMRRKKDDRGVIVGFPALSIDVDTEEKRKKK